MKIYAIREHWPYEIYDLVEFFLNESDAKARALEFNASKPKWYDEYKVEEVVVREGS